MKDHKDFPLPPDVVFFCQPEGCYSVGAKRLTLSDGNCFVFTLTDKDSGKTRYGICMSFFRPFKKFQEKKKSEKKIANSDTPSIVKQRRASKEKKNQGKNHTLTSLCFLSHHPFFSSFRECLFILKKIIETSSEHSQTETGESIWSMLTGVECEGGVNKHSISLVKDIETWLLRLLSAPAPVPCMTRIELRILPSRHHNPLVFAMPDHTRFSLVDFPLHLPLELLGVDTCLKVLTLIVLEHKLILQSRDYNALSMSVMAFVAMMYPLEYMFPVIPLLPTCMSNAEQLLLVPTPFIIGVPASFIPYKNNFKLPDDVWLVDLDSSKITPPSQTEELLDLPEPEGSILKNHLTQALVSMSSSPIKDINQLEFFHESPINKNNNNSSNKNNNFNNNNFNNSNSNNFNFNNNSGFNPLIYGNDVDSVDVATRVAMVRFFNSPNTLGNLTEHTRTLRLYPRPVVAFQVNSFLRSRPNKSKFICHLARTQAVEYFVEWALNPTNAVFLRIHTGIFDPLLIGDKCKWFSNSLRKLEYTTYDDTSSLLQLLAQQQAKELQDDQNEESSSASEESSCSSYSSLSDFVADIQSSNINGDSKIGMVVHQQKQVMLVDEGAIFHPPTQLVIPPESSPSPRSNKHGSTNSDDDSSDCSDGEQLNSIPTNPPSRPPPPKLPPLRPPPPSNPSSLNRGSSLPPPQSSTTTKKTNPHKQTSLPHQRTSQSHDDKSSIIETFTDEINTYAQTASNTFNELFGDSLKSKITNLPNIAESLASTLTESERSSPTPSNRSSKPFTPLGNRRAEKSTLVRHSNIQKRNSLELITKQSNHNEHKNAQHSENQLFLKEITTGVLEGRGVGWLKMGRVKKLMEDETYRNFMVSRLNTSLDKKLSNHNQHLDDVCISKAVFKGMLAIIRAIVSGLEVTFQNQGTGGMASAMMLLEIVHTHYWEKEGSSKSDVCDQSLASSPFGSNEALSQASDHRTGPPFDDFPIASLGSPVIVNGDEFENIEIKKTPNQTSTTPKQDEKTYTSVQTDRLRDSSGYVSESCEKDEARRRMLGKTPSVESDASDFSSNTNTGRRKRSDCSFLSSKSQHSTGYRYREGRVHHLTLSQQDCPRNYLFENLIGRERSVLWEQVQFWEDVFLDAVAQERDIIGMDQGPMEMMERYESLNESEKRRLEFDEDGLLGCMLYNMVSFMLMMKVNKHEVRRKCRRLLGKCHIGLSSSSDINQLLDQLETLGGNDIDLKPLVSRLMQKQSFTVHWGPDNTGDMLFMEVCDDCLILRSVSGCICDRWWYEKLVNMTYCPKTRVFCLWRKHNGKSQLNKFYTKKCKELYNCVKSSMEKAASKTNGKVPGLELDSEFPVQDMRTGQGGLLQVCMEGIGLLFANSKLFIELCRIKKCSTLKGGIFVLEEFDPKNRKIIQRRYKSAMAAQICYAILCIFSYVAAGIDHKTSVTASTTPARPSPSYSQVNISITGSRTI